jgi:hypothetical protein
MSKKSVWNTFAFACARAAQEDTPRWDWVCSVEDAKWNWDIEDPTPEGDALIAYNCDPLAGELEEFRIILAKAGCKELGFAEYPDAGVVAGHTFAMVIDAGGLRDSEMVDLMAAAREKLEERQHHEAMTQTDKGYYGTITPEVYAAALHLRGDDETCWEEKVPLTEPPLIFGPDLPEELFGDMVIDAWEGALAEAQEEHGEGQFVLESLTVYLVDDQNTSPSGEFVFKKNVKVMQ